MKGYYFNPNNYGTEYIIIEESESNALDSLKKHLKNKMDEEFKVYGESVSGDFEYYKNNYEMWKDSKVENLPLNYSIEEFEKGHVIETELS